MAAAVVVEREGKILFVRRANEPKRGIWTLPSGFVDSGEDPDQAAERECLEETGLKVTKTDLIDVISEREHLHCADFVLYYRAEIVAGEFHPSDDAEAVNFFPLD